MASNSLAKITIKSPSDLEKKLELGVQKMSLHIDMHIRKVMERFAIESLKDAIAYYDESTTKKENLTGNTRTGFCAALYSDGRFQSYFIGFKVAGIPGPSWHYAKVGDSGFTDYGTGERIEGKKKVKPYSSGAPWQDVDNGKAFLDTLAGLKAMTPECTDGWVCVLANASPYVSFLVEIKHIDILEKSMQRHKYVLKDALDKLAERNG